MDIRCASQVCTGNVTRDKDEMPCLMSDDE